MRTPGRRQDEAARGTRRPRPARRGGERAREPRASSPARAGGAPGPACPHFPRCIGCPLVAVPYPEQLAAKDAALREALATGPEAADGAARIEPPCGSPRAFGYRNQAKLVFRARHAGRGRREVVLGVYRPGTHSVSPADGCIVHHRGLQPVLRALRAEVERLEMPIFDERTRTGALRYALARVSSSRQEVHLTLVSAVPDPERLPELVRRLRAAHRTLAAMFLCVNPTPGNVLLSSDVRRLFGPPALLERFGDLELESRPDAFVQANPAVAARVYATARAWLEPRPDDRVVDLYCGVGAIGLHLAPHVAGVLGIEAQASSVACARANARRLGARNARFVAAPAEEVLRVAAAHAMERPTVVAVNPPRKGLTPAVIEALERLGAARLLYVSCDPRTLARDVSGLARGYVLRRARAFDMLPQTPHVEAVALLVRRA